MESPFEVNQDDDLKKIEENKIVINNIKDSIEIEKEEELDDGYLAIHDEEISDISDDTPLLSKSIDQIKEQIFKLEVDYKINNPDNINQNEDSSKEAIIIGAGPVGCYTAIQLRHRGFKGKIYLYQRYKVYQRKNIITLPSNKDVCSRNKLIEDFFNKQTAPIADLEEMLLKLLKSLPQVYIMYYKVDCLESIKKIHSNPIIFHTNGAHSKTRDMLLDTKPIIKPLFHVLQFSYNIRVLDGKPISTVGAYNHYKIEKYLSEFTTHIEQTVNILENKVTVRFFIDSYFYDSTSKYSFKNPGVLNDLQTDKELLRTNITNNILFYMKFRSYYNNERPLIQSLKFIFFRLDCYRSTNFAITKNDINHFFVGDSALGVPFYRSLRNGLIESNNLASLIMNIKEDKDYKGSVNLMENSILRTSLSTKPVLNDRVVDDYNKFMEEFSEEEFLRARKITVAVGVKDVFLKVSSMVPWQINKITDKIKAEIEKINILE